MTTECANGHKSIAILLSECRGIFAIKNSRAPFVDQAQDLGIKAVRSGAGRDDYDQHEGIEDLGQIKPIVDPICFVDRLVDFNSLQSRRSDGDEDDYE